MRVVPILLTAALGLALGPPVATEDGVSLRIGSASLAQGSVGPTPGPIGPTPGPIGPTPGTRDRLERDGRRDPGEPHGPHKRHKRRPFFVFPHSHDDDDDDDRFVLVPIPAPRPEPPEAEPEPAAPAPPPDPRGAAIKRARGAAAEAPYTVGEPLPGNVPHVTLDWRRYELPEPPAGKIYARVGREVLLIDAATRVVERRVEPPDPAPEEG